MDQLIVDLLDLSWLDKLKKAYAQEFWEEVHDKNKISQQIWVG